MIYSMHVWECVKFDSWQLTLIYEVSHLHEKQNRSSKRWHNLIACKRTLANHIYSVLIFDKLWCGKTLRQEGSNLLFRISSIPTPPLPVHACCLISHRAVAGLVACTITSWKLCRHFVNWLVIYAPPRRPRLASPHLFPCCWRDGKTGDGHARHSDMERHRVSTPE